MGLYEIINVTNWFEIRFTENDGMAFGMDFIGTMFLALFRMAAIIFFSYILYNIVRKNAPTGFIVCFSLVVAGAAGNIIDNCLYGSISEKAFTVCRRPISCLLDKDMVRFCPAML